MSGVESLESGFAFIMTWDELKIILAATGFPPVIAPSVVRQVFACWRCSQPSPCAAGGNRRRGSSLMPNTESFSRSNFSRSRKLRRSARTLLLTFLACKARSRLQTRCLSTKSASVSGCARKRWRTECCVLFHELAMVDSRDAIPEGV